MAHFGRFYLDKEKDIVVTLWRNGQDMTFVIETPNHGTGNLITNLAKLTAMPLSQNDKGMLVIKGDVPSYINGDNQKVFIMRLANTKVANIYPDGLIERKAYIPAIAKTLMSQTKDYALDVHKTLVKTYIPTELKFHSDLHTHRSANLSPDILIALGIHHQINYPYYYVKKLNLKMTDKQRSEVEKRRETVSLNFIDSGLKGKYLDRRIDDNTEVNFADLILNNLSNSSYNIARIRASLAVMKDGQAVFTNLEKVYLYRYVFTKGVKAKERIVYDNFEDLDDKDIVAALKQMDLDRRNPKYANNTLYQDKLLWTARSYRRVGVDYAEISDTALVKKSEAAKTLQEIHEVMPYITEETGVTLRFLAALRRIPLTIVKDAVDKSNYFQENLEVLKAVAEDPYVAGSDFVGEEINDIMELKPVIKEVVAIAKDIPGYVVRIHAGENDSLPDNVYNSLLCVEDSLLPDQEFPYMRIGHGLYTAKLNSSAGKKLLSKLKECKAVLEFQITSNVRLNNLSEMDNHPLKQYIEAGVECVQGTDGGALYGSDSMDEQLSLERMLDLTNEEMRAMRNVEDKIVDKSMEAFYLKQKKLRQKCNDYQVEEYFSRRILEEDGSFRNVSPGERKYDALSELKEQVKDLPKGKVPIVLAGGSFNNARHETKVNDLEKAMLDDLIMRADPEEVYFVIGPSFKGYEGYLYKQAKDKFDIFAYVPAAITGRELEKIKKSGANIRVSIEASPMGIYKSIAFEVFKRGQNILLALDGNSAAGNLIQDTKNSKYKCYRFINQKSMGLRSKAESLQGYVTMWKGEDASEILSVAEEFFKNIEK